MTHFFSNSKIVAFIIIVSIGVSFSQVIDTPYAAGTWRSFRPAAVSYTFDDGCANQFTVAIPLFNAKGCKLTLFTVVTGGMFPGWTKLQSAASQGHEIASHTMTHTSLSGLTSPTETYELKNSKDSINAHIPGMQCITMAYPNCVEGTDTLNAKYYYGARTCSGQLVPKTPSNFSSISSILCGSLTSNNSPSAINKLADNAVSSNSWCIYLMHGIDNDGGYSPVSTATLQGCLDYTAANPAKFWVETFGNVIRYIKERNSLSVKAVSRTPDSIAVRITDTLNDALFNYPVTIRRPLPSGWQNCRVTQGTSVLSAQVKDSNNIRYIYFDAVPDGGNVVMTRTSTSIQNAGPGFHGLNDIKVRWHHNNLLLSGCSPDGRSLAIALFDMKGAQLSRFAVTGNGAISLPCRVPAHGMYIVAIADRHSFPEKRFLLQSPERQ